jgi:hypothetical protein
MNTAVFLGLLIGIVGVFFVPLVVNANLKPSLAIRILYGVFFTLYALYLLTVSPSRDVFTDVRWLIGMSIIFFLFLIILFISYPRNRRMH